MDKKLAGLIVIFLLTFSVFSALLVFREPITQFTRAKEDTEPDPTRSKIIAWPINDITADGLKTSEISIFVRSVNDRPLENKSVVVTSSLGTITPQSAVTSESGEAKFTLTSASPGSAEITASIQPNITLTQKISIEFE